jgi:hypothetical protein
VCTDLRISLLHGDYHPDPLRIYAALPPEIYDAGEQLEIVAGIQADVGIGPGGRYEPFVFYLSEELRCFTKKTRSHSYGVNRFVGTVKEIHEIIPLLRNLFEVNSFLNEYQ